MSYFSTDYSTTEYHWILTVELPDGRKAHDDGTANVRARGAKRDIVFADALASACAKFGDDIAVVRFDLAPNDLPGGAR